MTVSILKFTITQSPSSSLKALADIQISENNEALITIYGVKLIQQRHSKTFIAKMPSLKKGHQYQDICSIDKTSLKKSITSQLIQRYLGKA